MTDESSSDAWLKANTARDEQFDAAKLSPDIRSWILEVGEKTYWVKREVGQGLRWFYGINSGAHPYLLDFTDLNTGDHVTMRLSSEAPWTLTGSDAEPNSQ